MLTKVAIILICLVALFGFGRRRPALARSAGKEKKSLLNGTNILLAVIAVLLVLTLITTWVKD